ncbi:MAG: hypothetical protein L0226_17865 [Acidobacteria bacterium]|nr:hypothetical protein [Acidobacteriota bacterium]
MLGCQLLGLVGVSLLVNLLPAVYTQESILQPVSALQRNQPKELSGLLPDRLSVKDLEKWRAIERLVFAEDNERQPLHPTLRWLWEWIDTSGHAVYVEVIRLNRTSTCTAGNFSIEYFDPGGGRHVTVIKLNLPNIDQAYVGPHAARADGFVPFVDLNKEERYAEVLGHEMTHAVHILNSPELTGKVKKYVEETNSLFLSQHVRRKSGSVAPELKNLLSKRDDLLKELEAQAENTEKKVWRELVASKPIREKMPVPTNRK